MTQSNQNKQDIKPGKEKLFQAEKPKTGSRKEEEFKKDAVERKYSKEPAQKDSDSQESLREEENILDNEGAENIHGNR